MKREIVTTGDGLKTIHFPDINESYHSTHGAFQEAMHVFIKNGFQQITKENFSILEIGFGTGLNAILTLIEATKTNKKIEYTGLEAFPLEKETIEELKYSNYPEIHSFEEFYSKLHNIQWEEREAIHSQFTLLKIQKELVNYIPQHSSFDLIYFDAFGPRVQPEMWTKDIFKKLYNSLKKEGIFVTYCAKGQVRRDLAEIGFKMEKIPGPPGKREMLRGVKEIS